MKRKTLVAWSSGKDSAWALHTLRAQPDIEVAGLFCTVNKDAQRVAMHAVRTALLQRQAAATGLPLEILELPDPCGNADYEQIMTAFLTRVRQAGIDCIAFGDLFLRDVRAYREERLADSGIQPVFPLWDVPTDTLSETIIASGTKAIITCVDSRCLSADFVGRPYDHDFLDSLPPGVDPCGENGEFHSFVWDGPMFSGCVPVVAGQVVQRDAFVYIDLVQAGHPTAPL